jgi:hypothetical protein
MRVGEQQDVEAARLFRFPQCKIDRGRQRPGRIDAAIAQRRRRAVRLMNVIKARQHRTGVDRRRVAGRLDHESDALVVHRQRVAAVAIGANHVPPVRHEHARNAGIIGLARAASRPVLEDDARHRALIVVCKGRSGRRGTCSRQRHCGGTAFDDISPCDPMVIHRRSLQRKEGTLWNKGRSGTTRDEHFASLCEGMAPPRRRTRRRISFSESEVAACV